MGFQLALFPGIQPVEEPVPEEPPPPRDLALELGSVLPGQVGLFDAHVLRLKQARDALSLADLPGAITLLEGVALELDRSVPVMLGRAQELRRKLQRLSRLSTPARVVATVEVGRGLVPDGEPWSSLGRVLLSRAASELEPADGLAAGRLFLEAGDPAQARRALGTIQGPPSAALLFALADAEHALEDRAAARLHSCEALLLDPFDAGLDTVADEEVRGLPYVAEFEAEIEAEPRAWCAPVGVVAGVLPRPGGTAVGLPMPAGLTPERTEQLARARQFVDGLVRAGSTEAQKDRDALLETRRDMRQASAPLFAWYMARRVGRSH